MMVGWNVEGPIHETGRVQGFEANPSEFCHDIVSQDGDSGSLLISRVDSKVVGYHNAASVSRGLGMIIPDFR